MTLLSVHATLVPIIPIPGGGQRKHGGPPTHAVVAAMTTLKAVLLGRAVLWDWRCILSVGARGIRRVCVCVCVLALRVALTAPQRDRS
jgi:hypothetical protein